MTALTDLISNFGDIIELDYPKFNGHEIFEKIKDHRGWKPYNPRKIANRRLGLSVTSLDGSYSGVPDLDSLREFNYLNNTNYTESDFKVRTDLVNDLPELAALLNDWSSELGRSHFLNLKPGGFFPPHRDNGSVLPTPYFRILVPIIGFGVNDMKWVQEDRVINFEEGIAYFVNTSKVHSLFSFVNNCVMLVLNIQVTENSVTQVLKRMKVK